MGTDEWWAGSESLGTVGKSLRDGRNQKDSYEGGTHDTSRSEGGGGDMQSKKKKEEIHQTWNALSEKRLGDSIERTTRTGQSGWLVAYLSKKRQCRLKEVE